MHDLVTAPRKMIRAIDQLGEWRTAVIHYEDLVEDPESTLVSLCSRLELDYVPDLKEYAASQAALGDATAAQHHVPVTNYLDRWKRSLDTPVKRDIARSYVDELGPDLIHRLGYHFDELVAPLRWSRGSASLWECVMAPDELLPGGIASASHLRILSISEAS